MEKEKSLVKKKSKKPLVISLIVAGVLLVGAAVFYFVYWRNRTPEVVLTDAEFLSSHSWEKEDAPTVIWNFKVDGSGEITTNKSNYYEMSWKLKKNENKETLKDFPLILGVTTAWLYDLDDSFELSIDREEEKFTVKNLADGGQSTFLPLGTTEAKAEAEVKAESNSEN